MASSYEIFEQCRKGNTNAQRMLYELYKGRLMGLCRRYTQNRDEAQDVLQESFIRIFTHFDQLRSPEKLESWMKSTTIRTAINFYHKGKGRALMFTSPKEYDECDAVDGSSMEHFSDEFLVSIINRLPDGCRLVFNMFAIEGYSHAEIAEMLNVSEGTSRSQFHHAKLLLKQKLNCQNLTHYYEKFS
jgi:RNA polymerase sigma-70 factor (ECF subfamily)